MDFLFFHVLGDGEVLDGFVEVLHRRCGLGGFEQLDGLVEEGVFLLVPLVDDAVVATGAGRAGAGGAGREEVGGRVGGGDREGRDGKAEGEQRQGELGVHRNNIGWAFGVVNPRSQRPA